MLQRVLACNFWDQSRKIKKKLGRCVLYNFFLGGARRSACVCLAEQEKDTNVNVELAEKVIVGADRQRKLRRRVQICTSIFSIIVFLCNHLLVHLALDHGIAVYTHETKKQRGH